MPNRSELSSIVFMKVGTHANETFEDIVKRKQEEYRKSGRIFWGYGGGTMHPISKVQPFARYHIQQGTNITLVMQGIVSNHWEEAVATEYSEDGVNWQPIPNGIEVRGSRYALVLDEIQEGDLSVDLSEYRVGYGPSEGKPAPSYIQGRVDKGLLVHTGRPNEQVAQKIIRSNYSAKVKEPFAVLLRSNPKA